MPEPVAIQFGLALTGEHLPLKASDVEGLVDELAALGWDSSRLQALRCARQEAEEPWPFPTDRDVVAGVGFAAFHAGLEALRERLGLTGLVPTLVRVRPLDAHERRLLADRPPHWG